MLRSAYRELAKVESVRPLPRSPKHTRLTVLARVACEDGQLWWFAFLVVLPFRALYYATRSVLLWPWH
jgi:hypothetical protein